MAYLLARGNAKLSDSVLIWSLPAHDTCPTKCKGCYAWITQRRFPNVGKARAKRFEISLTDYFVNAITAEIKFRHPRFVRVHESGDFYSQEYIEKWATIAKNCPDVIFFAYTKAMDILDFSPLKALDNFVVHNSILPDGRHNFDKREVLEKYNGFICPLSKDRNQKCGEECVWCMLKENEGTPILFERH